MLCRNCKRKEKPSKLKNTRETQDPQKIIVESQIQVIRIISLFEIFVAVIIVLSQTLAIGASNEFATRSLTGIWTSWFFFMAAGLSLFWSSRCTFNGLLAVLVLQIIASTMAIPLFTACCILLGVYPFRWNREEYDSALVGSSSMILATNLLMIFASMAEMGLNAFNAYKCYFLAYGTQPKDLPNNYDSPNSLEEGERNESNEDFPEASEVLPQRVVGTPPTIALNTKEILGIQPPPDLSLTSTDILIIKICGVTGVVLAIGIFCAQIAMMAIANNDGVRIGIGIWGSLFIGTTGVVTVYNGWKTTSQSTVAIFVLHIIQLILSVPLVGIAYYIIAVFGSCLQHIRNADCPEGVGGGVTVAVMGAVMALSGMAVGLLSLILILICSNNVCGIRCMVSGATVYPTL